MPTLCHFDIPVDNVDRAKQLYKDLFEWNMKKLNSRNGKGPYQSESN